jgi:hypothetical protein
MKVHGGFLLYSTQSLADAQCHPVYNTSAGTCIILDQRAQKIDEDGCKVKVDDNVARQQRDGCVTLKTYTTASIHL